MGPLVHIETERLRLRDWKDADAEPFAAMNADRRVMEFFPAPLKREQSDELMARIRSNMARDGFGLYAVEVRATRAFIGFTGLAVPTFAAPFTPATEIGWRGRLGDRATPLRQRRPCAITPSELWDSTPWCRSPHSRTIGHDA